MASGTFNSIPKLAITWTVRTAAVVFFALSGFGCSTQWMDAAPDTSPENITSMLGEIQNAQAQSTNSGDLATALQNSQNATVYFADAPSNLSSVPSLVSFTDFSFLGGSAASYAWENIYNARVFFFVNAANDSGNGAVSLIVGIDQGSGYVYYALNGQGNIDGGTYAATLSGGAGQVVVESDDVSGGSLASVIQLRVYTTDSSGDFNNYVGKFSTLVGYNQR